MMEVYAGALAHCDHQIGRVIDAVEETGEMDNTLIIFIQGDNGASAEGTLQGRPTRSASPPTACRRASPYLLSIMDELGGPMTYNHYPVGWAHAMDTPFQWTKQVARHFGGTRNGLVISWPDAHQGQGQQSARSSTTSSTSSRRSSKPPASQAPTMINGVKQKPIEGVSMVYTFDDAKAPRRGNHPVLRDARPTAASTTTAGWPAPRRCGCRGSTVGARRRARTTSSGSSTTSPRTSRRRTTSPRRTPRSSRNCRPSSTREAKKYNVYPLDSQLSAERVDPSIRPSLTRGRNVFTYYPGTIRIPEGTTPDVKNKSYSVTADVEIPEGGADGVLATQGGRFGGWGLLVLDGKPVFVHAFSNQKQHKYRVAANEQARAGQAHHQVRLQIRRRRLRQGRHRHAARWTASRSPQGKYRAHDAGPLLARRDLRCRRGHRHAGRRGLCRPRCRSSSPASLTRS